ncbi:uncharacterized protein LOC105187639 [Harpegnathos saltator]|uniref:uncharacterized protein LOC105187639 n=1 Tax=Harpegnathos saltator TaxID=610380 RepID=UPI0005901A70|nr:uncharacterized protein LOC105187639 [Harpegnathos saltator]
MSIIELLTSCDRNSKEFESLVYDLLVNNSGVPFDNREVDAVQNTIVTSINSRINVANTRYSALVMLDKILSGCSKDIFSKYALLWITKTTELLQNTFSTIQEITLACKVLGFLFEHCKEIPELHKQISMQNIRQLIPVLDNLLRNEECGPIYYLIAVMLYHYPEICERSQESIKKIILLQIDSTQKNSISASAKCFVLLSKATERSFQPPSTKSMYTRWTYNQTLLCNNLHAIMDELFSTLMELKTVDIWDKFNLPSISEENVIQYYNEQKQRFLNLCIYLSSMLCGYDANNSVVPHDILEVLCRGLAITPLNLRNKSSIKEQMLYMILPKLHIGLFTVLDALISGFAQELIPFGKTILNLFQQVLQWTSQVLENHITFNNTRSFKNIRISTYKCLSTWLINTNSLSGIETVANEYIAFIMKDIVPEQDCILLAVQKPQHLSKRMMKRFKDSQYENSPILNNRRIAAESSGPLDADLCKEALITLQNILHNSGVLLKPLFYKNVQNTVIPLLYNFYLRHSMSSFYKDHDECRLELFKVLRALQLNPDTTLITPIQFYLEISHSATHDVDLSIAQEARFTIAELEKVIHPIAPTLQLPRQNESDNESLPENQEEVAIATTATTINLDERNRIEHELSQEADAILPPCKRQKIIMPQSSETIQNKTTSESINMNDDETNFNKLQIDKESHENIENLLQDGDKVHCNKKPSLWNRNELTNGNTETEVKCKLLKAEHCERSKDSSSEEQHLNEANKLLEINFSLNDKEIKEKIAEKVWQKEEESDTDDPDMLNLFHDVPIQ